MSRYVTLAFVAAAVSFVASGAYAAGGLVNGGFETDVPSVADPALGGWLYWDNGNSMAFPAGRATAANAPDGPGPHSGTAYAYIHVQDPDGAGWPDASIAQAVDLSGQVGTRLVVSYWYNIKQSSPPPAQYVDIYGYVANPGVATAPDANWWQYGNGTANYRQPIWNEAIEDNFNVSGVWTQRTRTYNQLTDPSQPYDAATNPYYHPSYFALVFRPHEAVFNGVPQDFSIAVDDVNIYLAPPGDANQDGQVSVGDLGILAANYGTTTGATWATGDFNYDGAVSVGDLGILAANYGVNNLAGGAVPEPATLSLLGLGVLALRRRR